jgi:hypothetical protein
VEHGPAFPELLLIKWKACSPKLIQDSDLVDSLLNNHYRSNLALVQR